MVDNRKTCPFKSTLETAIYCTSECALSVPCDDMPNGVICSFVVIAELLQPLPPKDD